MNFKSGFTDRLSDAAKAKKRQLEKFRSQAQADDPAAAERNAARQAVNAAREARLAERKAVRQA
jgi:hypothetical protein